MNGTEADPGAQVVLWIIRIAGAALLILSAVCHKLPRNRLAGIRFPHTLADDEMWGKVHRRGRWVFFVLGLACFVPIRSLQGLITFTIGFLAVLIVSTVYLYVYARREYRNKFGTTRVVSIGFCKFRPPTEEELKQDV
ncbi:MAG: SdpI family protein [Planctomycetota bacterium]